MSKLEELIARLCPDGVEYKELKFISKTKRGTLSVKKNVSNGTYSVISGGKEFTFFVIFIIMFYISSAFFRFLREEIIRCVNFV